MSIETAGKWMVFYNIILILGAIIVLTLIAVKYFKERKAHKNHSWETVFQSIFGFSAEKLVVGEDGETEYIRRALDFMEFLSLGIRKALEERKKKMTETGDFRIGEREFYDMYKAYSMAHLALSKFEPDLEAPLAHWDSALDFIPKWKVAYKINTKVNPPEEEHSEDEEPPAS